MLVPIAGTRRVGSGRFAVELLEDRSLFSGLAGLVLNDAGSGSSPGTEFSPGDRMQLLEISRSDDAEESHTEAEVSLGSLPASVVAALRSHFRGGFLMSAELDGDAGSPMYDVRVLLDSVQFEVALDAGGKVVEIEQAVELDELPPSMRDWITQNFPGAVITEATLKVDADATTYEVLIATGDNESFEAAFLARDASVLRNLLTAGRSGPADVLDVFNFSAAHRGPEHVLLRTAAEPVESKELVSDLASDSGGGGEVQAHEPGPGEDMDRAAHVELADSAQHAEATESRLNAGAVVQSRAGLGSMDPVAAVDEVAADSRSPAGPAGAIASFMVEAVTPAWVHRAAMALVDSLPLDLGAVEKSLRALLGEFEPADEKPLPLVARTLAPRLLMGAAAIGCAERLITHLKRTRSDRVLSTSANDSTWNWMLNLANRRDTWET